jgi:proteic killer suppression protein
VVFIFIQHAYKSSFLCKFVINNDGMILSFKKEYLRELYETGTTSSKKHRFQPEIIRAYVKCIYRLEEAIVPEDLYKYKSLNFEALAGD